MGKSWLCNALVWGLALLLVNRTVTNISGAAADTEVKFKNKVEYSALLRGLREGGHVIYFRHAMTEADYADQVFARSGFCSTQRVLSEQGWQQARSIGKAFQQLKIPVGQVISSEYCRAWQTADLAFGKYQKTPKLNFQPAEEYTDAQVEVMRAGVVPLISAVPPKGVNTIVVGHDDPFEAATGIYPEPQGVAFVVKPLGNGKFELLAMVGPGDWDKLR